MTTTINQQHQAAIPFATEATTAADEMVTAIPMATEEAVCAYPLEASVSQRTSRRPLGAVYYPEGNGDEQALTESKSKVRGAGIMFIKLGRTEFRGQFVVPRKIRIYVLFHGGVVDLSRAVFVHPETTITVVGMFGGCEVILPPGVKPETSGVAIFGGFDDSCTRADLVQDQQKAPTVRIEGATMFGGVTIVTNALTPPLAIEQ